MRTLTARKRSRATNFKLGLLLAFVAGAVNAGGFMVVGRYTSHVTGILSAVTDDVALGQYQAAFVGFIYFGSFLVGASCSALIVHWARRQKLHSEYALPLAVEACLLLIFGTMGSNLNRVLEITVPLTVVVLCFSMGFQNALITKISKAEIRTTHMTGVVTDLGIELGRLVYWNRLGDSTDVNYVRADRNRLRVHVQVLLAFTGGALFGAFGYKAFGMQITLLFSSMLLLVAVPNLMKDMRFGFKRITRNG